MNTLQQEIFWAPLHFHNLELCWEGLEVECCELWRPKPREIAHIFAICQNIDGKDLPRLRLCMIGREGELFHLFQLCVHSLGGNGVYILEKGLDGNTWGQCKVLRLLPLCNGRHEQCCDCLCFEAPSYTRFCSSSLFPLPLSYCLWMYLPGNAQLWL